MPRSGVPSLLDQFWRAQARIGLEVQAQALAAWAQVNPAAVDTSGVTWLRGVLLLLRAARSRSRRNAIAFYRLYRALETGHTVQLSEIGPGVVPTVSLGQLRQEWAREASLPYSVSADDFREIPVEAFAWPEDGGSRLERAAAINLAGTGVARAQELTTEAMGRGRLDDPDFLASLESAGRNAANVADNEAIRAGRDLVDQASKRDRRVVGWARVTDGNPCHFCAMLASRGAIYTSRQSAEAVSDGRPNDPEGLKKYHPGCHCQVVPVYSRNDFLTPEARRLSREWKDVTRGKSGAEARKAWRQHMEARQRTRARAENERLLRLAQEA